MLTLSNKDKHNFRISNIIFQMIFSIVPFVFLYGFLVRMTDNARRLGDVADF